MLTSAFPEARNIQFHGQIWLQRICHLSLKQASIRGRDYMQPRIAERIRVS